MNKNKHVLGLLILVGVISACSAAPEKPLVKHECKDPRPQMCTMIYQPVCGLDQNGSFKTYSSGCNACSHLEVLGYNDEACKETVEKQG